MCHLYMSAETVACIAGLAARRHQQYEIIFPKHVFQSIIVIQLERNSLLTVLVLHYNFCVTD